MRRRSPARRACPPASSRRLACDRSSNAVDRGRDRGRMGHASRRGAAGRVPSREGRPRALRPRRHAWHPARPVHLYPDERGRGVWRDRHSGRAAPVHDPAHEARLRRVRGGQVPVAGRRPGHRAEGRSLRGHDQHGLAGAAARLGPGRVRRRHAQAHGAARAGRRGAAGLHSRQGHAGHGHRPLRSHGHARHARLERAARGARDRALAARHGLAGIDGLSRRDAARGQLRARGRRPRPRRPRQPERRGAGCAEHRRLHLRAHGGDERRPRGHREPVRQPGGRHSERQPDQTCWRSRPSPAPATTATHGATSGRGRSCCWPARSCSSRSAAPRRATSRRSTTGASCAFPTSWPEAGSPTARTYPGRASRRRRLRGAASACEDPSRAGACAPWPRGRARRRPRRPRSHRAPRRLRPAPACRPGRPW